MHNSQQSTAQSSQSIYIQPAGEDQKKDIKKLNDLALKEYTNSQYVLIINIT